MSTSPETPVLPSVTHFGSNRFAIVDQHQRYWTGTCWSQPNVDTNAVTFSTANDALIVSHSLLLQQHEGLAVTQFVCPVYIDMTGPVAFEQLPLRHWLFNATKLIIDYPQVGCGPVARSYVECCLEYKESVEIHDAYTQATSDPVSAGNSNTQPCILSLVNSGTPEFRRWSVADQYLRYWTGSTFTEPKDHAAALKFADWPTAQAAAHKLLMSDFVPFPMRHFVAPLYIAIHADTAISTRDLEMWLIRATKLLIDSPPEGNGTIGGAFGTCRIGFDEIKTAG